MNPGIVDLFAGPGGWDEALTSLGRHDVLGIEYDEPCCLTREAAGHATLHANVAELNPLDYAGIEGLIASPPCQAWSAAGARGGEQDKPLVYYVMEQLLKGNDLRAKARADAVDERSLLVVEPLRWALAVRPRWIACEQVEPVLELWKVMADQLRTVGYSTWAGVLSAERYGVPQTRRRAFLIASLDRGVHPPAPTHQRYVPGEPAETQITLEGELLPWVSMAEALGWADGQLLPTAEKAMGAGMVERHGERRGREATEPAFTIRANAGGNEPGGFRWSMRANAQANACVRGCGEPAPTIKGGHDYNDRQWVAQRPSPTIDTGTRRTHGGVLVNPTQRGHGDWPSKRPATTVQGDPRIAKPGWRGRPDDYDADGNYTGSRSMDDAVRVTLEQALVLQGFRPDYPVQGNKAERFKQVGNAVPPPLAAAVLTSVMPPAAAGQRAAG